MLLNHKIINKDVQTRLQKKRLKGDAGTTLLRHRDDIVTTYFYYCFIICYHINRIALGHVWVMYKKEGCTCMYVYACLRMYVCVYMYVQLCMSIYAYVCVCIVYACVYTYVFVCLCEVFINIVMKDVLLFDGFLDKVLKIQ